ncbi:hypothetical protein GAYE_SCF35G5027 [Galdieria yellowstonensis]|uniref:Complex 1 LYR protein domain-containing protein n=1 Tax=Galdieria yellowstonensis TaxID=3028027 RepID=A0AAV9IIC6_9RHOD|nr:hypothetical protein GAYE_SCF35G5027 [Galdieria yellowstonensis]
MSKKRLKQHKTRINCYPNDLDHFAGTNPVTNASNHSKEHFRVATRVAPPEYHQKKRNEQMKSSGSLSHKVSGDFGKIWAARMVESRLALQLYRALLKEGKKFPERKRAEYICNLTRQEFRKHQSVEDEDCRNSLLMYAMDQLENVRHLSEVFEKGEEAHHIGIHTGLVRVIGQRSFMDTTTSGKEKDAST